VIVATGEVRAAGLPRELVELLVFGTPYLDAVPKLEVDRAGTLLRLDLRTAPPR